MRKFVFSIIIIIFVIIAHCLVPFVLFMTGKYDTTSFFSKPPSVKLKSPHIDNNIDGGSAWRLTSIIKTHNMVDSIVEFRMKFCYKDGAPVLSKLNNKPIEIKQEIVVPIGKDHSYTNITNINYDQFPDESINQKMKWLISLKYKDSKGEYKDYDQSTSGYFIFYGYNPHEESEQAIENVQYYGNDITTIQSDIENINTAQTIQQQKKFDVKSPK